MPADSTPPPPPPPDSATIASAYVDATARELVRLARERRDLVDRSIEAYEATVRERTAISMRAVWRERLLWERETASRISWQRDGPIRIEILGAREALPQFTPRVQVPAGIERGLPHLVFDPADAFLVAGWGDDSDIPHPLASGSERDYRFRTGDTTVIRLPDGRDVRLLEVELLPRRRDWKLVSGSLWLDADTHSLVRVIFRLADEYDFEEDGDEDLPGILSPVRVALDYVVVEYGLWDFRWWLPRAFAMRGAVQAGRVASLPFSYERTYADYTVRGEPATAVTARTAADTVRARCPTRVSVQVQARLGNAEEEGEVARKGEEAEGEEQAQADTAAAPPDSGRARRRRELTDAERAACERIEVVVPEDRLALLESDALSPEPFASGEALLTEAELDAIRRHVQDLLPLPWQLTHARFLLPFGAPDLVRYNRVEGLSLGARVEADFGPLHGAATARLGVADLEPNGELSIARAGTDTELRLAGYRRLVSMDPNAHAFALGSSLSALLLGRDDADYFRTLGVELRGQPVLSRSRWYDWRLYAQQEDAAAKETDFSVRRLIDRDHAFPPNDTAAEATQYGAALALRGAWGQDPLGLRTGAELALDGAGGTFEYARTALTLSAGFPLPGAYVGMLEAGGGASFGDPARQHLWRIGGARTVRGYVSGTMVGETFWRARAEIATQFPMVRLALFSDAGWAGDVHEIRADDALFSAGIGISLMGGLVRIDLARAISSPTGWGVTVYADAWQ